MAQGTDFQLGDVRAAMPFRFRFHVLWETQLLLTCPRGDFTSGWTSRLPSI